MSYDYDDTQLNWDPPTGRGCACCGRSADEFYEYEPNEYLCRRCLRKKSNHRIVDEDTKCEKCGKETDELYTDEYGYEVCDECFYEKREVICGY